MPSAGDRSRAARAWSELDDNPPTAILPTGLIPSEASNRPPSPAYRRATPTPPGVRPDPARPSGPPPSVPSPAGPPSAAPGQVFRPVRHPGAGAIPPAAAVVGPGFTPSPPQRRTAGWVIAVRIISAVVAAAVLAVFAFYWGFANNATKNVADSKGVQSAGDAGVVFRGGVNILLVGSDARTDADGNPLTADELAAIGTTLDDGGINTDTIMVLHIPQGGGKATAVSLPRDTYIPQSITDTVQGPYDDGTQGTYKPNKINSFYGTAKFYTEQALAKKGVAESPAREKQSDEAGRTMLIKIVQAFTGLKVDHYAEVNLIGFYTLSNAIGGVPVCLNTAVQDGFSGANFKAGPQEVQGSSAMSFVRQRHGLPNGDLDRVRRQQAFLAGATSKMLSAGVLTSPSRLNQLAGAAGKALTLDSGFDLLSFAEQMSGLSGGNVIFTTIPTHGADSTATSDALATDPAEIKAFFAKIDGGAATTAAAGGTTSAASSAAVSPASVTIDVQDATSAHDSGTPVMDKLAAAGFQRGQNVDFAGGSRDSTTVFYPKGAVAAGKSVQAALGGAGTMAQDDTVAKGHVLVVVGQDLARSGLRMGGRALVVPAVARSGTTGTSSSTGSITAGAVGCVN